ncbi:MAG: VanZ family protein [Gordonibacter sp.]|uniref:VanZ family protein n=1 Tax=Gordonibacter sp. TaxID=1968902 RepID=UPI002FC6CFD1
MDINKPSKKPSTIFLVFSWALVVGWACFIFFMSSNTDTGLDKDLGMLSAVFQNLKEIQLQVFGPDVDLVSSIGHFCEYLVLGMLLANAFHYHVPLGRACLVALACASAYGVTDEFHQLFVPGRMCDPMDWLVDTVGAGLGSGLAYLVIKVRRCTFRKEETA